jgi:hypothetical protein
MGVLSDMLGYGLKQAGNVLDNPGAAIRGALAGKPSELARLPLGNWSDVLGVTSPQNRTSGRDLLRSYGAVGEEDNWGNFAGGMAADMATNPLTYVTGPLAKGISKGAGAASKGFNPALRAARKELAMAKRIDAAGVPEAVVGGTQRLPSGVNVANELRQNTYDLAPSIADRATREGLAGVFLRSDRMGGTMAKGAATNVAPNVANRHEVTHGLMNEIAKHGHSGEGLPWVVRMAGNINKGAGDKGVRAGLGQMADEMAAFAMEKRGLPGQVANAANFLFNPNLANRAGYAADIAKRSPWVGRAYRAAPYATGGAGTVGAAGAGYEGYDAYMKKKRDNEVINNY